jgi:hypothetical protein
MPELPAPPRQRYRIEWYRGHIHPSRLVNINENNFLPAKYHTTVHAVCEEQAKQFGLMRRPGLLVVVTPAPKDLCAHNFGKETA